jgi:hypothetical protein
MLLFLTACNDFGLVSHKPEPADTADTGLFAPDTATNTDSGAATDTDSGRADAPATDTAVPCHTFTFAWTAPLSGEVTLIGELSTPDGTVFLAWQDLVTEEGTNAARVSRELCSPAVFRGEGALDSNGDGVDDSWACHNQGAPGAFGVVGEVTFALDGAPLTYTLTPAPGSEGCELTVEITW